MSSNPFMLTQNVICPRLERLRYSITIWETCFLDLNAYQWFPREALQDVSEQPYVHALTFSCSNLLHLLGFGTSTWYLAQNLLIDNCIVFPRFIPSQLDVLVHFSMVLLIELGHSEADQDHCRKGGTRYGCPILGVKHASFANARVFW